MVVIPTSAPRAPGSLSPVERADYLEDAHSAIHLAVLCRDGLISLDAGRREGALLSRPFVMAGEKPVVEPGCSRGSV